MPINKQDALDYHSKPRPGKTEVTPTKPCLTQRDLSLAYTPGVAVPCLEIEKNPQDAFKYTNKGNLVAVVTNGTAVLGLGDIGAIAGKPVMEGKGVLFKRFAGIDVFDIELNTKNPDEIIKACQLLEPTFGGINLEDIKAPECFYIEETLKKTMKIPVFHDDQHGTAIITGAALLNAVELTGKKLDQIKVVINGAGASGIATAEHYICMGVKRENITMVDTKGVVYKGRKEGMNPYKERFAQDTPMRTLAEAAKGADLLLGLSVKGAFTPEMIASMAPNPLVFAMANPDPEITYEEARAVREDLIMATGRSDYPNQINNVLGFPSIFRGALDVHATTINEEMKLAASYALAALAKEDVPDSVCRAYGVESLKYGRDYIIPTPFDPRVLVWEATAVAKAAIETGVAQNPVNLDEYRDQLENRLGKGAWPDAGNDSQGAGEPQARGLSPKVRTRRSCAPAISWSTRRLPLPVLLGRKTEIERKAAELGVSARRHDHRRSRHCASPDRVRRGAVSAAAAPRRNPGLGRRTDERPQCARLDDGAHGRCRRARLRRLAELSRHHPAGLAGDRRARRHPQGLGHLSDHHPQGRFVLPGRCDGQHRTDGRGPGGDRSLRRAGSAPLRHRAASGDAVLLQLWKHQASAVREDEARGRAGRAMPIPRSSSTARCKATSRSMPRSWKRHSRSPR